MNAQLNNQIARQQARMRELREDARDLANTVADEVWDKFEVEVEQLTADEYHFIADAATRMALSSLVDLSYGEAFERHVLGFFTRQTEELQNASAGCAGFDSARIDLAGMRKGLKLHRHSHDMIGQAIERAKPGVVSELLSCLSAATADLDAMDRQDRDNAKRLRSQLFKLRGPLTEMIREETGNVIQTARLAYVDMLDMLSDKIARPQTSADAL